jgi:hypothetical protein
MIMPIAFRRAGEIFPWPTGISRIFPFRRILFPITRDFVAVCESGNSSNMSMILLKFLSEIRDDFPYFPVGTGNCSRDEVAPRPQPPVLGVANRRRTARAAAPRSCQYRPRPLAIGGARECWSSSAISR